MCQPRADLSHKAKTKTSGTSYNYQSKGVISLVLLQAGKKQLQTNQTRALTITKK